MAVQRCPVLLWDDAEGRTVACLLHHGADQIAACAADPEQALDQLRELLARQHLTSWSFRWVPLDSLELVRVVVPVVAAYRHEEKLYPCTEAIRLPVTCVTAVEDGAERVCIVPRLGLRFYYQQARQLKWLLVHYVQEALRDESPAGVASLLGVSRMRLGEIRARLRPPPPRRAWAEAPAALSAVALPLGGRELRRRLGPARERGELVAELVRRLVGQRESVLLIGEPGCGKSTALAAAARAAERSAPGGERRFWSTSAGRLVAGMRWLGDWEERCATLVEELARLDGVLCVENLLELVRSGGSGPGDSVAAFLLTYVEQRELRLVAETTPAELAACRRLLPGLVERFGLLRMPALDRAAELRILRGAAVDRARSARVELDPGVPALVHQLHRRFLPSAAFPGRACRFLGSLFEVEGRAPERVDVPHVLQRFVAQTGLPELLLCDDVPLALEEVQRELEASVIGQPAACVAVAERVIAFKAGLNDPRRPIGVLLFCGPTGVGKTELARALGRLLFGHGSDEPDRLIRLDMSEYSGPGAAERLLSGQAGNPSELVQRIRRQPFNVVLFDEIEKAHAELFDLLLGLLDEGRLTDRLGRVSSFCSAVVILTSNIGARPGASLGFGEEPPPDYLQAVRTFFRPEFYNRLDRVVSFGPLERPAIETITARELGLVAAREGLAERRLVLRWTDEALALLARRGFDPRYGARPLQRACEDLVTAPLARLLVTRPALCDCTLWLRADDEELAVGVE